MTATKLIINGEEHSIGGSGGECECTPIIPVVTELPNNPVEWQIVIYWTEVLLYFWWQWELLHDFAQ